MTRVRRRAHLRRDDLDPADLLALELGPAPRHAHDRGRIAHLAAVWAEHGHVLSSDPAQGYPWAEANLPAPWGPRR